MTFVIFIADESSAYFFDLRCFFVSEFYDEFEMWVTNFKRKDGLISANSTYRKRLHGVARGRYFFHWGNFVL